MFLKAEAGPVASGHGSAATKSSLAYVIAMDTAVRLFWPAHAPEIKRLCGPSMPKGLIDQQEVFGFALADGLNRPLIPHYRARGVGSAGDDAIKNANRTKPKQGALRRAKEAKRESVRKATAAAEKDASLASAVFVAERKGDHAIAEVLTVPCNLKLSNETVGAKRTREPLRMQLRLPRLHLSLSSRRWCARQKPRAMRYSRNAIRIMPVWSEHSASSMRFSLNRMSHQMISTTPNLHHSGLMAGWMLSSTTQTATVNGTMELRRDGRRHQSVALR